MVQENEVITLIVGLGGLVFLLVNLATVRRLTAPGLLIGAYLFSLGAWVLTVLEGFFLPSACNVLEHSCYALASLTLGLWIYLTIRRRRAHP